VESSDEYVLFFEENFVELIFAFIIPVRSGYFPLSLSLSLISMMIMMIVGVDWIDVCKEHEEEEKEQGRSSWLLSIFIKSFVFSSSSFSLSLSRFFYHFYRCPLEKQTNNNNIKQNRGIEIRIENRLNSLK
jgi:hypothetical protein